MSNTWGIVPAAGLGTRIQPLAFSKELLPVGVRMDASQQRPRAVSEYLLERMTVAGANRICFVVSPGKSDIMQYFGGKYADAAICYAVQQEPHGLCDALFTALPFISDDDEVLIGLPDTVWFPVDGFERLPARHFSFLLFQVQRPELFDAVVSDAQGIVSKVQVKVREPDSDWAWGAFRMPGKTLAALYELWMTREPRDEYFGTLVNAYISAGGTVSAVKAGEVYVDVGTLHGYHEAVRVLMESDLALVG
jgi:glucose-1-phosphate thymidylyltransferase